ncbi:MAG TPA: ABC transporter ATP-binding protein [Candidatus Kapabacteria bacterium]
MSGISLTVTNLTKRFGRKPVFEPVSLSASSGEVVILAGANGSGKSTLIKLLAGVLSPSTGKCDWSEDGKIIEYETLQQRIGFVAPYLELYNELSAAEHIEFVADLKSKTVTREESVALLTLFGLDTSIASSERYVGKYSSGMQQRVRFAMAFACSPDVLFLDEPSSNLDDAGTSILFEKIKEFSSKRGIVFIATNDAKEKSLGTKVVTL